MSSLLQRTRLFGILAHVDAGKTTVSERMLYLSGRIHRMGEVHNGNTTLDHDVEERKHGITISAAASSFTWRPQDDEPHALTLIDTPGHVDFAIEVERALRVLDGAVVVLDGSKGVEPQTESVWRQAQRHGVARLVFVNKMDAPGASFEKARRELAERLGARTLALQHLRPDGQIVDLISQQLLSFADDGTLTVVPVNEAARRAELIESLAELDAEVMQAWANDEPLASEFLHRAIRRLTCAGSLVPVLGGAALRNRGIPAVLDAVARYLPSPLDRSFADGLRADAQRPTVGFVFKTEVDEHLGSISWVRVLQGTVHPRDTLVVGGQTKRERVSRVLRLHGGRFEPLTALAAGSIGVVVGLRSARTGDTLASDEAAVVLERIGSPEPVVEVALTTRGPDEMARLAEALRKACLEDPSLRARVDDETGQTVLCGVGELHLAIWLEKLERREGLELKATAPTVSYRDTVGSEATVTYRHVRQNSGPGQFAVVTLSIRPNTRGVGVTFADEVRGGAVPAEYVRAVERGANEALSRGIRDGVPVIDAHVTLLDGVCHAVDSSSMAFEIAASMAVQEAVKKATLVRLEPIARVHLSVPEQWLGPALSEVTGRRGLIRNVAVDGGTRVIEAQMPLARSFGFVTALRSRSEGRAAVSLAHDGFEPVR